MTNKPHIWTELEEVIEDIDADKFKTKVSQEKTKAGKLFYNPAELNQAFRDRLYAKEWERPGTISFYATDDAELMREVIGLDHREQKRTIEARGKRA